MSMYPIASFAPTDGSGYFAFTSIPQTFTHLQIRASIRSKQTSSICNTFIYLNGDSGSNYAIHRLKGDGSTAISSASTPQTSLYIWETTPAATSTANVFESAIVDILDYTNTSKNKTARLISGVDLNGSGAVSLTSGLWLSTATVTSIGFATENSWASGSRFDLYGIQTSNATGA